MGTNFGSVLCPWLNPVSLVFPNNLCYCTRDHGPCYRIWSCYVEVCCVYLRWGRHLSSKSVPSPVPYHIAFCANKMFTIYVWCASGGSTYAVFVGQNASKLPLDYLGMVAENTQRRTMYHNDSINVCTSKYTVRNTQNQLLALIYTVKVMVELTAWLCLAVVTSQTLSIDPFSCTGVT